MRKTRKEMVLELLLCGWNDEFLASVAENKQFLNDIVNDNTLRKIHTQFFNDSDYRDRLDKANAKARAKRNV